MPAQNRQDVIDAWNNTCGTYSFSSISGSGTMGTMGSAYSGNKFGTDCPAFMTSIAQQVQASFPANPNEDDLVDAVIDDPTWY